LLRNILSLYQFKQNLFLKIAGRIFKRLLPSYGNHIWHVI